MARTTLRGKCRVGNIYIWKGESISKVRKWVKGSTQRKWKEGNVKNWINKIENKEPIEKKATKSENKR